MTLDPDKFDDQWAYDAYRIGRVTEPVTVATPNSAHTLDEGHVRFDPINQSDTWKWNEETWTEELIAPGDESLTDIVRVHHELLGIVEFPHPMTEREAQQWLDDNPTEWRPHIDEHIASDVTAADLLDSIR